MKGVDFMVNSIFKTDENKAKAKNFFFFGFLLLSIIYLIKLASKYKIHFKVSIDPFYSDENMLG